MATIEVIELTGDRPGRRREYEAEAALAMIERGDAKRPDYDQDLRDRLAAAAADQKKSPASAPAAAADKGVAQTKGKARKSS